MYILISLFYASLLGIVGMILYKRHEVKTGHPTILSRLGRGSDHVFHAIFSGAGMGVSYINKHTFIALAQWIAFHVLLRIRTVYIELKQKALDNPHSRKVIDMVRGKGEVSDHGASFYLRRISAEEGRK